VDTVDTALIDPSNGNSRLTVDALRRAVGDGTTHLFLNKLDDVDGLAEVLEACGEQLRVLCLVECTVGLEAMCVLAAKAAQLQVTITLTLTLTLTPTPTPTLTLTLQGLVFQNCTVLGLGPGHPGREGRIAEWDACLAALLAACPQLLWLSAGFMDVVPLGQRAWQAVPASLHALEVECPRGTLSREQIESIRAAKQRLPSLSWLMVSRDRDAQSSVTL
jgi:hypothetical protein